MNFGLWTENFKRVYGLLSPAARGRAKWVLFLMVLGMGLETLGVGLVMPAIAALTDPDGFGETVRAWSGKGMPFAYDRETVMLWGLAGLVAVFVAKNVLLAFMVREQAKFSFGVQEETSAYLFESYLSRPYAFHLKANTSELLRNSVVEVNSFVGYILQPGLMLLTEAMVICAVGGLLLWVEPLGTVMLLLGLSLVAWLFQRATCGVVSEWGRERQCRESLKIKHLQEGFGGVKEVKLLGSEAEFTKRFRKHNRLGAEAGRKQYAMQQMPRLGLEALAVAGLACLAWIMVGRENGDVETLPKLGILAVAVIRLMPSANRIVNAGQSIRYGWPCVEVLERECGGWQRLERETEEGEASTLSFDEEFVMEDVSYGYPETEDDALKGVSLSVRAGESVGIVGESGAGKSTLVDALLGLLEPKEGALSVDGKVLRSASDRRAWQGRLGYVPQDIFLSDDSLRANVAFGVPVEEVDEEALWEALKSANLEKFARELPEGLDTLMGERGARLSGGQRQRVGIARALYRNPSLIVLDEATSSLDPETEEGVLRAVRALRGEKTFVIVAHRASAVEHCDVTYRVEGGRIVERKAAESLSRGRNAVEAVLGSASSKQTT